MYYVFQVVKFNTEGGTIQRLYNSILKSAKFILPPTKAEQTAIATALNDADALITGLEKLISKKKAIKQGAMQELLKSKEGDALSLSKGWETKTILELADNKKELFDDGDWIESEHITNIGETKVVTSVDVTIFRPRQEVANRVFLSNIFSSSYWFGKVSESVGGTTHKRISRSSLGKI